MSWRRFALRLLGVTVFSLALAAPVGAGDETCRPEPITPETPSGIAGCTIDGPTVGVASTWGGTTTAAQWCVYPWTDCGWVRVTSHLTGLSIESRVGTFCDCWWSSDRRLVDLTRGQVLALGLDPAAGIFEVTVTVLEAPTAIPAMSDTAVAR